MITQADLRAMFDYDPSVGKLLAKNNWRKWKAGCEVGTTNQCGYRQVCISGRIYLAHRLAWLYVYGVWPAIGLDHKNRVRDDNRIDNLRLATQADQRQNQTNVRGCYQHTTNGNWVAQIQVNRKLRHIGVYATQAEASAAYAAAKKVTHIFNPEL